MNCGTCFPGLWAKGERKMMKGFLKTLGCLVALVLTAVLLWTLLLVPGGKRQVDAPKELRLGESFRMEVNNGLSDALSGIAELPKTYWIEKDAAVAPEPDQSCYGEASDPAELDWLLEKAAPILEGQELFFSTDRTILPDSTIHYYLDETIFAISWKENVNHMGVTYSEVKIMDPSQFRRHLSGGSYCSGKLMLTSEMAEQVNAVMAFSGDFYDYRRKGTVVLNGTVCRANDGLSDICYVDDKGDLLLERKHSFASVEEAQQYMDEKGILFSMAFGPILVEDYQPQELPRAYMVGQLDGNFSREALCQMDKLHYLVIVCNNEKNCYYMPTGKDLVKLCADTGCIRAYNLDGGQTSTVVMNNEVLNNISYGSQRLISDIFYFATAKPKEN